MTVEFSTDSLTGMNKRTIQFRNLPKSNLPKVIRPGSLVILAKFDRRKSPDWATDCGRIFRVGYYNSKDGLDCIWLVNSDGEYEQTVDRKGLLDHFFLLQLSNESDLYGRNRKPMKALRKVRRPTDMLVSAAS